MSKKNKGSSAKKTGKKAAKKSAAKTKAAKKPTPKKSPAKKPAPKKAAKPAPKKKVVKKAPKKAVKPASKKTVKASKTLPKKISSKKIAKPSKSEVSKKITGKASKSAAPKPQPAKKLEVKAAPVKKVQEFAKKPVSKRDSEPIPEFKPIIQPKVKTETVVKEGFPTVLKSTSSSSFITTPARKTDSYSIKPEKEPPGKFELEFVIRSSAELLYEFLVTPSGLSEWFCDDVNIRNGIYTFVWDGQLQQARLLKTVEEQLVRYQWVDKSDGSYFEFKIQRDELTNDISLMVVDFANEKGEQDSAKLLWTSQIDKLLHVLGSYF